jgi:hypothetical protein
MLAKSVKYNQPNARELLQSIFELIVKVLLLSFIQDADVPYLRQNFVQRKFLFVSFDQMRHL